jgi:GAF domain-containing protein
MVFKHSNAVLIGLTTVVAHYATNQLLGITTLSQGWQNLISAFWIGGLVALLVVLNVQRTMQAVYLQAMQRVNKVVRVSAVETPVRSQADMFHLYDRAFEALAKRDNYRAITEQLLRSHDLNATFHTVIEQVRRKGASQEAALFLLQQNHLKRFATWQHQALPDRIIEGESVLWRVIQQRKPVLLTELEHYDEFKQSQLVAVMLVPLLYEGQAIGLLLLGNRDRANAFSDQDLLQLRPYANHLALAAGRERILVQARKHESLLATFAQLSRNLSSGLPLDQMLREILAAAIALTSSSHGSLMLLDAQGEQAILGIVHNRDAVRPLARIARPILRSGLAAWVVRERSATIVKNTLEDSRWVAITGLEQMRSAIAIPLLHQERVIGVLTLADDQANRYTEEELLLLETLAAQAAFALERAPIDTLTPLPSQAPSEQALQQLVNPHYLTIQKITVVSMQLCGLNQAQERLNTHQVATKIVAVYEQVMTDLVQQWGGTYEISPAGHILAMFGTGHDQQCDPQQIIVGVLSMREQAQKLQQRWRLQYGLSLGVAFGISQGSMTIKPNGVSSHYHHTVAGGAIQQAKQLQALARMNEILADTDLVKALKQAESYCTIVALPPFQPNGKTVAERIYRITNPVMVPST